MWGGGKLGPVVRVNKPGEPGVELRGISLATCFEEVNFVLQKLPKIALQ